jgi:hypothetical protein
MRLVLERVVHVNKARVAQAGKQIALAKHHLDVVALQNHVLAQRFHRKGVASTGESLLDDRVHHPKPTLRPKPTQETQNGGRVIFMQVASGRPGRIAHQAAHLSPQQRETAVSHLSYNALDAEMVLADALVACEKQLRP